MSVPVIQAAYALGIGVCLGMPVGMLMLLKSDEFHEAFKSGYAAGESSGYADWYFALSEFLDLDINDEELDSPMKAVKAINQAVAEMRRKE